MQTRIARDPIAARGFGEAFGHSLGHGLGLEVHEAHDSRRPTPIRCRRARLVTNRAGVYLARRWWGCESRTTCIFAARDRSS